MKEALLNEIIANKLINIKELDRLSGGKNSDTYIAKTNDKNKYIVKIYPGKNGSYEQSMRNKREETFLRYCEEYNIKNTPRLLVSDKEGKWIIMSWLNGERVKRIDDEYINSFVDFLEKLNEEKPATANKYKHKAKDSYVSIKNTINENQKRYNDILFDSEISEEIRLWVQSETKKKIETLGQDNCDQTNRDRLILSPSDVGIQNSLRMNNEFMFFDFEYGGLDDIHKTICDMMLQPNHLLDENKLRKIVDEIRKRRTIGTKVSSKVIHKLLNVYQVRWILIMAKHVKSTKYLEEYNKRTKDIAIKLRSYLN
ncbi:hypothetical protein [Synechococcus sp. A15-24]|uniref:hypothetical protein n=1 Tax=Synechococcus sp. A15-24 TaxID=1050635 RepID=UPI0016485112|nr:hypothetical protein [Synechococcus sp. A15-24]